jgi:hypothetical protein
MVVVRIKKKIKQNQTKNLRPSTNGSSKPIETQLVIALAEQPAAMEITVDFLQEAMPRVLGDDDRSWKQEPAPADLAEDPMVLADLVVRWVEKDKVELRALRRQTFQTGYDLAAHNVKPIGDFELREVAADQFRGATMVLDEHYFPRTAAEGFETYRPAAGVRIEEGRAF